MSYPIQHLSIRDILSKVNQELILPALQREYVWKSKDIAQLFDSLMQEYPINTMMFWDTCNLPSQPIGFYQFLNPDYTEGNLNQPFVTAACPETQNYKVVIDGQQRITSLYIALCGSYKTPKAQLPQELYLRLDQPGTNPDGKYDFKFMNVRQLSVKQKNGEIWFLVKEAFHPAFNLVHYINQLGLQDNEWAQITLMKLVALFNNADIINYYNITANDIDTVLDIFVRANSGGWTLTKGDLLLSALTAHWSSKTPAVNARSYVEEIIEDIKRIGYKADKDWVLKCFLMLTDEPLNSNVGAFMSGSAPDEIYNNKAEVRASIKKAFELVSDWHMHEKGLSTKLAVIPIVYFIYKNNLWNSAILSTNGQQTIFNDMRMYLFRAILVNLYESGTDNTLADIRKQLQQGGGSFCYKPMLTPSDIQKALSTKKSQSFPILNIAYAIGYDNGLTNCCISPNTDYDVDHIHPKQQFSNVSNIKFTTKDDLALASDGVTFDTVVNLELLDSSTNRSKNKQELATWLGGMPAADARKMRDSHFLGDLPDRVSDFSTFILGRTSLLEAALNKC